MDFSLEKAYIVNNDQLWLGNKGIPPFPLWLGNKGFHHPHPPTFSVFITEVEPIDECKKEIKDEILKSIIATLKLTQ